MNEHMMEPKRMVAIVIVTVLSLGLTAFVYARASDRSDPPWVGTDGQGRYGRIDESKEPPTYPVLNSRGRVVGHVRTSELDAAPPWTPGTPAFRSLSNNNVHQVEAAVRVFDSRGRVVGYVGSRGFVPQNAPRP